MSFRYYFNTRCKLGSLFSFTTFCFICFSCVKQNCEVIQCKPYQKFDIITQGFAINELQLVHLRKFKKGSNFTELLSTSVIKNNENTVTIRVNEFSSTVHHIDNLGPGFIIESNYDYEFYVPATNTLRRLSEIIDIQEQTVYCRPSLQRNECRNSKIKSCRVDGVLFNDFIPVFSK